MNKSVQSSNDAFRGALTDPPPREMVFRFGEQRSLRKYICVVEGPTDEHFYGHTHLSHLRLDCCTYVYRKNLDCDERKFKGKEAVIRTYRDVRASKDLSQELSRTFFIFDRDFEKEPTCQESKLSEDEKRCFTLTPYHSMECFFLTDENLTKLFAYLHVPAQQKTNFMDLLEKFREEAIEHFALVAASVACNNHQWKELGCEIKVKIINKFNDIFVFAFNDVTYDFKRDLMEFEKARLKPEVEKQKNRLAYKHYLEVKESIMSNHLFIRGHTLADFLQAFLIARCNITFQKDLSQDDVIRPFIQSMDVDGLKLVFGNGVPFPETAENNEVTRGITEIRTAKEY